MVLRKLLPYTTALLVAVALYTAWILWSRRQSSAEVVQEQKAKEARQDEAVVQLLGGDSLKILSFYASPGTVKPGEKALVCYGVSNAKEVRIEPPLDDVKPSLSRCLEVHPRKSTDYTLIARDAAGHEVRQSFTLEVRR
jgi:hypothetical protein